MNSHPERAADYLEPLLVAVERIQRDTVIGRLDHSFFLTESFNLKLG